MRLRLLISEAWRSLGANVSTTVAATMTVLVGMFLLGLFIALGTWTVSWSNHVKRELVVKVYFNVKATRTQEYAVARLLQPGVNPKVKSINFVQKAKALEIMKQTNPDLVEGLPYNPLPDSFEVTPTKGEYIKDVYDSLHPLPKGVASVTDGKQLSKRILRVAHAIEKVFAVATIVLLIASTLLISNTIRLSIFSRRREIEVMKLVGATNWFVRGPFMIEGLLVGILGGVLAVLFLLIGKAVALHPILHGALSSDSSVHAMSLPLTGLILVGMGLLLGAIGSGVTIHRFLRV